MAGQLLVDLLTADLMQARWGFLSLGLRNIGAYADDSRRRCALGVPASAPINQPGLDRMA